MNQYKFLLGISQENSMVEPTTIWHIQPNLVPNVLCLMITNLLNYNLCHLELQKQIIYALRKKFLTWRRIFWIKEKDTLSFSKKNFFNSKQYFGYYSYFLIFYILWIIIKLKIYISITWRNNCLDSGFIISLIYLSQQIFL